MPLDSTLGDVKLTAATHSPSRARAHRAVAGLVSLLGVALVSGCSAQSTPAPSPSDGAPSAQASASSSVDDAAALATVEVNGPLGSRPTITVPNPPLTLADTAARVVDPGDGEALQLGSLATTEATYFYPDGTDAGDVSSTWSVDGTNEDSNVERELVGNPNTPQAVTTALLNTHVGGRMISATRMAKSTYIIVWDVVGQTAPADVSAGTPVDPEPGLPSISWNEQTGAPVLTVPDGYATDTLVVQPLLRGSGDEVSSDDSILARFSVWLTDGAAQIDSNWTQDTGTVIDLASQVTGLQEGLAGQPVGSRVLLVLPAHLAYGTEGSGTIPPNATVVMLIDILGVMS